MKRKSFQPMAGAVVRERTGRAIQEAVDEIGGTGGGIVFLPAGLYRLEFGIKLKSNVILRGEGRATVLKRSPLVESPLAKDAGRGAREVVVKGPAKFAVGMEAVLWDAPCENHIQDVARIKKVKGCRIVLDRALSRDYAADRGAILLNAFPVIYGQGIEGVLIEDIAIDGAKPDRESKGAGESEGVQLTDCRNCRVVNCTAYACGGFGLSCSGGENIVFSGCESHRNIWHGFHVGLGRKAGATRCTVENCYAHHNDWVGVYICWNVTESIFVGNHLTDNRLHGLLIGPFDNRNLIANNVISGNGDCGILVARRAHPCQHNAFLNNIICDNGRPGRTPAIRIESPEEGRYEHFLFARNMILETRKVENAGAPAIFIDEQTDHITVKDNYVQGGWKACVESRSRGAQNCLQQ